MDALETLIGLHDDPSSANSRMQSELPQMPVDEWNEPPGPELVGSIHGPLKGRPDGEIQTHAGTIYCFGKPKETRYVLWLEEGQLKTGRYKGTSRHQWGDIPAIGGTITEFIGQLEGFGEEVDTQATHFRRVQRATGSAMHTKHSFEVLFQRRGAVPDFRPDHTGGLAFVNRPHAMSKAGGLQLKENPNYVKPISPIGIVFEGT